MRHDGSCLISRGKATFGRVLSKTSWGNPKITGVLVVLPSDSRSLPEETVQSREQDSQEKTCLWMFMYNMFIWNNDPEAFGCFTVFWPMSSLPGLRESQACRKTSPGFGCVLFLELNFLKLLEWCGFLVILLWWILPDVSQRDLISPNSLLLYPSLFCSHVKKLHGGKSLSKNLWVNEWCRAETIQANKGWNEGDVVFNHASHILECPVKQICLT